ncbi:hypothetical protein [Thiothrix winogradskyi]|uniref:Uncharacterized protein n=1 Tax=Thiothrix winogradskyi TaxID=96472 RepID=A0ABY3SZ77_9GAMM|nr:hypothetical protein [Thiothrix winogradskyi]UJS23760.1 hypothetical protein L2Y54_17735 [Thiothrix winogradskyi]
MNLVNADIIQIPTSTSNKESNIETIKLSLDILEIAEYLLADNDLNKKISFQLRKINYSDLFNALISMSTNEITEAIESVERHSSLLQKNKFLECKKRISDINNEIDTDDENKAQAAFIITAGAFSTVEEYAKTGEIKYSFKREIKNIISEISGKNIIALPLFLTASLPKDEKIMAYDAIYWLGEENNDDDKVRMLSYFHANKENQFN